MKKEKEHLKYFANKIASYCISVAYFGLRRVYPQVRRQRRGVHIPSIRIPGAQRVSSFSNKIHTLSPPLPKAVRLQQLKMIRLDLNVDLKALPRDKKQKALYFTAIEANNCCWESELHLLHYEKIYREKHPFRLKSVRGWNLSGTRIAQTQISKTVSSLKNKKKSARQVIDLKAGGEEARNEEELAREELTMRLKEQSKQNYRLTSLSF